MKTGFGIKQKNIKTEIQQTVNLYKSGKFTEAEKLSKKLISTNPDVSFLYNLLGMILFGQGKKEDAIKYYKKGIAIKPDYAMIYNNLGTVYKSQKKYLDAVNCSDIVFAIGPAGTGKTYQAVAMAVASLKSKAVDRIVITRPAVEAGERLGFLPGDLKEKVDPYLTPLYDALNDMIPRDKLKM